MQIINLGAPRLQAFRSKLWKHLRKVRSSALESIVTGCADLVTPDIGTRKERIVGKNRWYQMSKKPSSALGLGYGGNPKVAEGEPCCYARAK